MSKQKLFILFTVLAVALIAIVPALAGISGSGASGVQLQNLSSTSPVNVVVELWNQNGAAAVAVSAPGGDTISANSARNYYLPSLAGVADGAYAMAVSAGGPIAAIARTEWNSVGGAALYGSVTPATDIVIPLVVSAYAGQTSQFSIQNTNTTAAISDVTITLYGRGSAVAQKVLNSQSIPAGTSKTYTLSDTAVWGVLPDNALDTGATGFLGSVRIQSATELVVQSFIDIAGTRGVTGFTGVSATSAATTLYCPLIRANYYGDTGISIVNPNASGVTVDITFYADAGSPNTGTFTQNGLAIAANSSAVAFQGPGGNSRAAGLPGGTQGTGNPTPTNNGFYGVAKLVATGGPIQAVVNDVRFGSGWSVQSQSSYNCATATEAGTKFALPLMRRYHLSTTRLTTGINIQNVTGSPVTVSLDLYNWDGTRQAASDPADVVIPAYSSGNYFSGSWTGLPTVPPAFGGSGWYGSAVLTATGNVVAVVADEGFGSTAVDSANYNGLLMP